MIQKPKREIPIKDVIILSEFVINQLSDIKDKDPNLRELSRLLELAARLSRNSCRLIQKQDYQTPLYLARHVIEITGVLFIIHFQSRLHHQQLSVILSDPQIHHLLRWLRSGGSGEGNIFPTHPLVHRGLDLLDEWLGGIRWQYDALVEFSNQRPRLSITRNGVPQKEEAPEMPVEYVINLTCKILVNFLTIGSALFDDIVKFQSRKEIKRNSERTYIPAPKQVELAHAG